MDHNVCRKETEQKPAWWIAIEVRNVPCMTISEAINEILKHAGPQIDKTEINGVTYQSPHDVWSEKTLRLVLAVIPGITSDSLIEIACLKEEKGHEEEGPSHGF